MYKYVKKYFLLLNLLFLQYSCAVSKDNTAVVDKRTELISVIARMAGHEEFLYNFIPIYTSEIDRYFMEHKYHDAVKTAAELYNKGFGYERVMALAVNLSIEKDSIRFKDETSGYFKEQNWNSQIPEFVKQINDFYTVSGFDTFFLKRIEDFIKK